MSEITQEHRELLDLNGSYLMGPNLSAEVATELTGEMVQRYSEPWRYQHIVPHIGDVLGFVMENVDDIKEPRAVSWAVWFHDSIYCPRLLDPGAVEEYSAQLLESRLASHLPSREIRIAADYIRKTAKHEAAGDDTDLGYFLDGDMRILGAPKAVFDEYDKNIGLEYSFVDSKIYNAVRGGILRDFYDRPDLYNTAVAREAYDTQARVNLLVAATKYRSLAEREQ